MQQNTFEIIENVRVASDTYRITFAGETGEPMRPGQFVQLRLPRFYLRRPISVYDREGGRFTLIYKVVGHGTAALSELPAGGTLDVLTGLGNGFSLEKSGERPLLIGGGVGTAPLYLLAKELAAAGKAVSAVIGFRTAAEVFAAEELAALGVAVAVVTQDGTRGVKGFVTDALPAPEACGFVYACGPAPMLRALSGLIGAGEFSLEERMGCGFGACMGCTCRTKSGPKRVCKDGPVFAKEELIW